ncbi:syncoilin [Menidia menidia]
MPLTSAGTKLRDTMVEYEGQLLGMLATLESCMEEAGMEFEPEEWGAGSGQEYVHIRSEPQHYRGTTLEPDMQERPLRSEAQSIQFEAFEERDKSSKDSRRRIPDIPSNSVETPKGQSYFNEDRGLKFSFSGLKMLLDDTDQDPIYLEETKMEDMFREDTEKHGDGHESDTVDPGFPSEERNAFEVDTIELRSGTNELKALGSRVENCIEEVQGLERRRKELLVEVLKLRGQTERTEVETEEWITRKVLELMDAFRREEKERREEKKRRIQSLKEERAEEERRLWKASLERNGLQDELRKLRRKLFSTVRDSTQSQAALNSQRREVEQLRTEEERMNSGLLQLMEESVQLRSAQQKQLSELGAKLQNQSSGLAPNRKEELSEGRRSSCGEVQQYLQGALKALEDRYEPILLALLKRREATAGALLKAKEESGGLKARLSPLREERQKLLLRRACLEEKLKLNHIQRLEEAARYKESVLCLEESSRELRTELQLQKRKTKEMQELRDSLAKKLLLHRAAIEDQNKEDHEDST